MRRACLVVFLALLAAGGVAVFLVGLGALYVFSGQEVPVTAEDRRVVLDIHALAGWVEEFTPDPRWERIEKLRYFDRSFEIDYEYEPGEGEGGLYLSCSVCYEPRVRDARTGFVAMWAGSSWMASALGDVRVASRNDLFGWGDQSEFGILTRDGQPIGNVFVARKGHYVFHLVIGGVYFDDTESISELLAPVLANLDGYRP